MNIFRLASVFSLRLACAEIISADYCLNSKLIKLGSALNDMQFHDYPQSIIFEPRTFLVINYCYSSGYQRRLI